MPQSASDRLKEVAARRAVEYVQEGMVVGLGTGSTAEFAIRALGERVAAGLRRRLYIVVANSRFSSEWVL